jgi:O-antigen/teichoic acid export membrane protein
MTADYVDSALVLGKGAVVNFGGAVSKYALGFVFSFVVARLVGAQAYGVYSITLGILAIARVLGTLGLKRGITRYTAIFRSEERLDKVKGTLVGSLQMTISASVPLAAVLMLASVAIAEGVYEAPAMVSVLRLMAIALPLWTLLECLESYVQGFRVMRYGAFVKNVLQPLSELAVSLSVILLLGSGLDGLAVGHVSSLLLSCAAMYVFSRPFLRLVRSYQLTVTRHEVLKFSFPLLFLGLLQLIGAKANPLLLGALSNSQDAGVYSVALQAASLGLIFRQAFGQILGPMVSEVHHKGDLRQLEWLYSRATRWTITMSLPVFLMLAVESRFVLGIIGQEFMNGSTALVILCMSQVVNAATGSSGLILTMSGRPQLSMLNQLGAVTLNVVLNLLLIPAFGLLGAAIADAVTTLLVNATRVLEVYWFLGIQPYRRALIKPIVSCVIALLVLWISRLWMGHQASSLRFAVDGLAFLLAYLAPLCIMGMEEDDVDILRTLLRRLRSTVSV